MQTDIALKAAADLSPVALFLQADIVVKAVMAGLLLASIWSWAIILERSRRLTRMNAEAAKFEDWFWKSDNLDSLYEPASRAGHPSARAFIAGMNEWRRSLAGKAGRGIDREGLRSRLASATSIAIGRDIDDLSDRLNALATIGSVAPFVGLFGTVWGIMNSFIGLSQTQQATLAAVAPGIAEALIATAIGLFAAIPAVIAYNRFSARGEMLIGRYYTFADEFQAILHRKVHTSDD